MLPVIGEHNDGPTGGAPKERSPDLAPNELAGDDIDPDETDEGL